MGHLIDATQRPEWAATVPREKPVALAPDGDDVKADWRLVYADENARHWLDMNRVIRHSPRHFTIWLYSDNRTIPLSEYGMEISNSTGSPRYLELRYRHFRNGRWHGWSRSSSDRVPRDLDDWEDFDNANDAFHHPVLPRVCELLMRPAALLPSTE